MPRCEDNGPGWSGEYPNCTYTTPGGPAEQFRPHVPGQRQEEFWGDLFTGEADVSYEFVESLFDPYDPLEEERLQARAATDIGQLREEWGLERGGLAETLGMRQEELAAVAGGGLRDIRSEALQALSRSGLARSGTIGASQREAERDIMASYAFGGRGAQAEYGQAIAAGELGLRSGMTDIGQRMEAGVYDLQQAWESEVEEQLTDIEAQDLGCTGVNNIMCPDGTCVSDLEKCPGGESEVGGCLDQKALNYNPQATKDNGSCRYEAGTEEFEAGTQEQQTSWCKSNCGNKPKKPSMPGFQMAQYNVDVAEWQSCLDAC